MCVIKKKKKEREKKEEGEESASHPHEQTCSYTAKALCTCQAATLQHKEGVSQLCPHAQVLSERGQALAKHPLACSRRRVNTQQVLPRCRFWNSHLCNNKPRGKRWWWRGGGECNFVSTPLLPHFKQRGSCQSGVAGGSGATAQVLQGPFPATPRETN